MLVALQVMSAAYLIGSVSFAVVASWAFGLPDPRNPGKLRKGMDGWPKIWGQVLIGTVAVYTLITNKVEA